MVHVKENMLKKEILLANHRFSGDLSFFEVNMDQPNSFMFAILFSSCPFSPWLQYFSASGASWLGQPGRWDEHTHPNLLDVMTIRKHILPEKKETSSAKVPWKGGYVSSLEGISNEKRFKNPSCWLNHPIWKIQCNQIGSFSQFSGWT